MMTEMIGASDWPARDRVWADTTRRLVQARLALLVVAAVACAVVVACAVGPFGATATTRLCSLCAREVTIVSVAVLCLLRSTRIARERGAWFFFTLAIVAWGAASVFGGTPAASGQSVPPAALPDAGYVSFYVLAGVALVLLAHARLRRFPGPLFLDGAIGALTLAALVTAIGVPALRATAGASTTAAAINDAYPVLDSLLLTFVLMFVIRRGFRPAPDCALIMTGLTAFALTDAISRSRAPAGIHTLGHPLDLAWLFAAVLLGAASLVKPPRMRMNAALEGWVAVIAPTGLAFAAAVLLLIGRFDRLGGPSLTLARLAIAVAFVRLFVSFAANQRLLAKSRRDAVSDELTGLGNRRALIADSSALFDSSELNPHVLAIYDLDGFKHYNDTFGHPAGDALLARLGASLAAAVGGRGKVYRLGGDEFCLLAEADGPAADRLVAEAAEGLVEVSARFAIRPSFGAAILPREAGDVAEALRLADEKMYAQKTTRPSPRLGTRAVLADATRSGRRDATTGEAPAERPAPTIDPTVKPAVWG